MDEPEPSSPASREAGDRALRQGAAVYFAFSAIAGVGSVVLMLMEQRWAEPITWGSVLVAFFFPFAVAMGIRRRERWARWLGFVTGLGFAFGGPVGIVSELIDAAQLGSVDPVGLAVRIVALAVAGVLGGIAMWGLGSKAARAAME